MRLNSRIDIDFGTSFKCKTFKAGFLRCFLDRICRRVRLAMRPKREIYNYPTIGRRDRGAFSNARLTSAIAGIENGGLINLRIAAATGALCVTRRS